MPSHVRSYSWAHRLSVAAVVLLAVTVAGWWVWQQPSRSQTPEMPRDVASVRHVVVLGDSVTTGSTCDCTPFPDLVESRLTASLGHRVTVTNNGVDGADTDLLLTSLQQDAGLRREVGAADMVIVTIGANDLIDLQERGPSGEPCGESCYGPPAEKAAERVRSVVTAVRALSPSAHVVVTDYWNVFTDGATVAKEVRDYNTRVTTAFNTSLRQVLTSTGATYVDLVTPFDAATAGDPTPLLLRDGDHPSAAGHQRIADAILHTLGVPG